VTYADLAAAWQLSPEMIRRWVSEDEQRGIRIPARRRGQTHRYVALMRVQVAEALLLRHKLDLTT
jgi:hypothetical protein